VYFLINLDRSKRLDNVEHPRIPEVIAQASSIFSGLMVLGLLFSHFNNRMMKNKLVDGIGSMYFNNF
jgi:hypothetical protein